MEQYFQRTMNNKEVGHLVEMVSTKWLLSISNPQASVRTDDCSGRSVDDDELFNSIIKEGMRDPLIIGVGSKTNRVRLESGNHRARMFFNRNILNVPAIVYVNDTSITDIGNGFHEGIYFPLKLTELMNSVKQYKKPSEILSEVPYEKHNSQTLLKLNMLSKW
jgi:hypothetical protein